jgi:septin family protein
MKSDSEFIDAFKSDVIHNMTMSLARNGGVDPMINVLAKNTVEKEFTVIIVPIPGDALKNVGNKEAFAEIIPMLFDEMFKNDLEPLCYSWSSEAW